MVNMWIRKLISLVILGILVSLLFITSTTIPVNALSVNDYFTYTYSFVFSKTNVIGNETFMVTVNGQAVCIQDLPLTVNAATIVSKIVARHKQTGVEVVLNPNYSIHYDSGFPYQKGQTASASGQVPLSFPKDSPSGVYDLVGQLLEAKVTVVVITLDIAAYLPTTQAMGTVMYSPSSTSGSTITTITTATTTSLTTTTTNIPTTTTAVIPSDNPTTFSTPLTTISSTTSPTTITPLSTLSLASFVLSDLKVMPAVVTNDKTVLITVLLSNIGDLSGTYEVSMKMDGQITNSQTIELASKSSKVVTFTHLVSVDGQHIVTIGDLSKEFTVGISQRTDASFKWGFVGIFAGLGLGLVIGCSIVFARRRKKS
jgi:hypothetical protein